jgi:aspartate/methionine/tyrosine aminotransferase
MANQEFLPFALERMMSKWENRVAYNLSESGVHPLSVNELVKDPAVLDELMNKELVYPQANGIDELRQNIASLYSGATEKNVLVTSGSAEANFNSILTMMQPGDEIVVMLPNYMQIWGIAHNFGFKPTSFNLRNEEGWFADLEELDRVVNQNTKLIAICNPNNPIGHILSEAEISGIVDVAGKVGAWILSDEVYAGAERYGDAETASLWGRYERVLAVGSLSKAYGLPGLRIGWVVAPVDAVDDIWARHEYSTISASLLGNHLAAIALSAAVRPQLIERTRKYIRQGYDILDAWVDEHDGILEITPPDAAAIGFVRYRFDINSTEFCERLIREKSVYIVPGDHFGMDHHWRISFGLPEDYLREGLRRVDELIEEVI